ncbi:MAG: transporter substrate-binding domain-containing protein [Alphaproteobacteria bacterium]|nr:transporter substrate-binding domain-containing protein [Alphaproteobacteria bacterium]
MRQLVIVLFILAIGIFVGEKYAPLAGKGLVVQSGKVSAYDTVRKTGVLRCGYVNWKPYYYLDMENGGKQAAGLNYDLMNELAKVTGLKIEWTEEINWGNVGEGFKTNRYDAVCTSVWPDAAKITNLNLSRPFFYSGPRLFVRVDDARFDNNPERMNQPDVKVAVIDGAASMSWVKENLPKAQLVALPQMVQESEYLMTTTTKKADIVFYDLDEMTGFAKANPNQLRLIEGLPPTNILPHVLAFADPQLTAMMNNALQMLIDNGVMDKIKAKYGTHYFVPARGLKE